MDTNDASTANTHAQPTLAEQTEKLANEFLSCLPEDARQTVLNALQDLMSSDVAANAVKEGDRAPDFTLPSARGGQVRLYDALAAGPVVLSFYRGGWCPFCNLELAALQRRLPDIQALGASLLAISPELPDRSLTTAEKLALQFEVLSDVGNKVARQFGLVMTVPEPLRPLYKQWGIDLPASNGDESYELPVPATYVIDTQGAVRLGYADRNYTRRLEPQSVIEALQQLCSSSTATS